MRELSLILVFVVSLFYQGTDSPHGDQLDISCSDCHTSEGWTVDRDNITFQHEQTGFVLEGTHNQLDCKQCHPNLVFSDAEPGCISCHDDMHEQTVGFDCKRCHNSVDWIVTNITEIHNESRFPLLGAHLTADCYSCHESASNLRFDPLGIECMDCHMPDYQAATNPNHVESNYSTNCTDCHQMNAFSWTGANFTHALFPLTEGHANIDCNECHKDPNDNSNISPECISCHQDDYNNAQIINHVDLDFSTVCTDCHTTAPGWSPAEFKIHDSQYFPIYSGEHGGEWNSCTDCHETPGNYAQFTCISCHEHNKGEMDGEHDEVSGYIYESTACLECHPVGSEEGSFNHATSNFPLTGAHVDTECADCHTSGYSNTPDLCSDCHMTAFNESTNPNHVEIGLENTCDDCHTTNPGWTPAEFQVHDEFYPLTGAHADNSVDCASCHNDDYVNTPNECVGCHLENYTESTNPNHVDLNFAQTCEECHTTNPGWTPSTYDHADYPLTGAHNEISYDCNACHNGNYDNTPNECVGCHLENYNQATNPNHVDLNFSQTCEECHTTNPGWSPSTFDHSEFYVLTGAHNTISNDCNACHNGDYENTPDQCVGCHLDNYNNSTNPNHIDVGFSQSCDECHTTNPGWSPATFVNHNDYWVIDGAHVNIESDCNACHNGNYDNTPNECVGCHLENYNETTNPNHVDLNFPQTCNDCHTTNPGWSPTTFDHTEFYPLTGAHADASVDCNSCHNGNYEDTPNECVGCHLENYNETTNPNHVDLNFPQTCDDCHSTNPGWSPTTFDHTEFYPLTGAHDDPSVDCNSCHNGNYEDTPNECVGCHLENYNEATNPNHIDAGFPQSCEDCHTTNPGWSPTTFNHDEYYPLTGAHDDPSVDCNSCHNGNYEETPNECVGCHIENYNEATNPNHIDAGFPQTCEDCHTTNPGWTPTTFDHDEYYPLTGAHDDPSVDCNSCHEGGYESTPNECVGCHLEDYNQTTDPNHVDLNFPQTCEDCHTTNPGWTPATFDHDEYYPLTGAHDDPSVDCNSCHNGNYESTPNECVGCHLDNYNQATNPNHVDLNLSQTCDDCHTTNPGWSPATFDDHNDYWVITGAHVNIANDCDACHYGDYNNTPNECVGCHLDDYNSTTNPPHASAQFPTDCLLCHTQNAWEPSTFDHDNQYFPIYSGEHNNEWTLCSDCHIDPSNYAIFSCTICHTQSEMDSEHNDVGGYIWESNACYSCHPDGSADDKAPHLNKTNYKIN